MFLFSCILNIVFFFLLLFMTWVSRYGLFYNLNKMNFIQSFFYVHKGILNFIDIVLKIHFFWYFSFIVFLKYKFIFCSWTVFRDLVFFIISTTIKFYPKLFCCFCSCRSQMYFKFNEYSIKNTVVVLDYMRQIYRHSDYINLFAFYIH